MIHSVKLGGVTPSARTGFTVHTWASLFSLIAWRILAAQAWNAACRCRCLASGLLGPEHPSTLNTQSGLGSLYQTLGDYAEAERLARETLAVRERVLGFDHPITQTSRNDLAFSMLKHERFGEAKALATKTLVICQETLGEKHTTTITALVIWWNGGSARSVRSGSGAALSVA